MAVRCNVEVLDLELRIPDTTMLELPSCIFLCGSLRSLSVHCNKILTAPSLDSCTNLQAKVLILSGEMTKALLREGPVSTPCGDISYLGVWI
ncbi:F-box/RNI-like superfamily protein [Prunus dulcis]|uniref:F-box/RNI-like superfamily protein n=1 Tax=Prunus dulcis TaxID=3755 RepID=A0A4Y1RTH8_PRUDU|nr:F-box/RNI-like superfamily protein [Prunus dulcis]